MEPPTPPSIPANLHGGPLDVPNGGMRDATPTEQHELDALDPDYREVD